MNDLTIRKDRWPKIRNAVTGLLLKCELPIQRIVLSDERVSALGSNNVEVGRVDLSSDYSAPAWVQLRDGGSTTVHIEVFCD